MLHQLQKNNNFHLFGVIIFAGDGTLMTLIGLIYADLIRFHPLYPCQQCSILRSKLNKRYTVQECDATKLNKEIQLVTENLKPKTLNFKDGR